MAVSATTIPDTIRAEPFRIFFPLAFLLGVAGVSHWALLAVGAIDGYLAAFHAVTQMQSFMLAFAVGFLLTAIPKRTRSAPASWTEIGVLLVLVPAVSVATLLGRLAIGQAAYAAALIVLAQFAIRRFAGRASGRRPPASFVLVPIGLLTGLAGAAMLVAGAVAHVPTWAHSLGRTLVLEGVFFCFALGIGGFFLSLALHGEAPADASRRAAPAVAAYAAAGLASTAALVLQDSGEQRLGLALRAALAGAVLVGAGAWRFPTRPGLNRWLLWLSAWSLPAGLFAASIFPEHRVAAMHLAFIGGFGLLAFSVSTHVTLGHSGHTAAQAGRPWPVAAFALLFGAALVARAVGAAISSRYIEWLGVAAALWLAAASVWAAYLVPKMWRRPLAAEPSEAP